MGIRTCLDTLAQVVESVTPVSHASVRFRRLPDSSPTVPMGAGRVFELTVTGQEDDGQTGFRGRRRHLVELTLLYPAHFGGRGREHVVVAEDVARIQVALGESNVGLMAGVGIVHPTGAGFEVEPITPEGKDSPSGLVVTLPFVVAVREA